MLEDEGRPSQNRTKTRQQSSDYLQTHEIQSPTGRLRSIFQLYEIFRVVSPCASQNDSRKSIAEIRNYRHLEKHLVDH